MECSINELTAVLQKAAIGSGLPVGLSQDAARAAVWLASRGHDGVGVLLKALSALPAADTGADSESCLVRGPSAIDMSLAAPSQPVTLDEVALPILIVGFAGVAAASFNCQFTVAFEGADTIGVTADHASLSGSSPARCGVTVQASIAPSPSGPSSPGYCGPIDVQTEQWHEATTRAATTYVPATEASRLKGAGAGLTDND